MRSRNRKGSIENAGLGERHWHQRAVAIAMVINGEGYSSDVFCGLLSVMVLKLAVPHRRPEELYRETARDLTYGRNVIDRSSPGMEGQK